MKIPIRLYLPLVLLAAAALELSAQPRNRIDRANFDTTCAVCADFYQYANGAWIAHTAIPATEPMWGAAEEVSKRVDSTLRIVVRQASRDRSAPVGSPAQLIGAYYRSCMDLPRIEARGVAPLRPLLAPIESIRGPTDVSLAISRLQGEGIEVAFDFVSRFDELDATKVIAVVTQGGLGLPTRDEYFGNDARSRDLRAAYQQYLVELFAHAGDSPAQARDEAARDMSFELSLASASSSPAQLRAGGKYRRMLLGQLQELTPHFAWHEHLTITGAPAFGVATVGPLAFFDGLDSLIANAPAADWRSYLRAAVLRTFAPALDKGFVNANFRWRSQLIGVSTPLSRDETCVSSVNATLGELLGHEYVRRAFTPAARQRALDLVTTLKAVLHDRIASLDWMSPLTKQEALAKVAALRIEVGYPDAWHDYSGLRLADTSYVANLLAVRQWSLHEELSRIGRPSNRALWPVAQQEVDAFAARGRIIFPAGILQPPLFDPTADDAVNYGAIGSMIGHELTHHFDDQGRFIDADGKLRDWWSQPDAAEYESRAARVVEQFNAYTILDSDTHVNGKLTLGENIADLGGLKIAYLALERLLEGRKRDPIDGFTPEQRFFLGYAQMWRSVARPEYLRTRVNTDPHAPWMWRVNGPLSNMPEFAAAWGCKAGDPMVRSADKRAAIW